MTRVFRTWAIAIGSMASACSAAGRTPDPVADAKGFYLATKRLDRVDELPTDAAYKLPSVEGVYLRLDWDALQTGPDTYDWRLFDAVAKRAIANKKKLSIGVTAGSNTPQWLAKAGVPFNTFTISRAGCMTVQAPTVWNDAYIKAYIAMMKGIKDHLIAIGGYDSLKIVKITAISESSQELRLPVNSKCSQTVDSRWAGLGYRPSKVIGAWKQVADGLAALYPGKLLIQPILQNQGLPGVDEAGKMIGRNAVDAGSRIDRLCITGYNGRCGIQWNALKPNGPMAERVMTAHAQGAPIGWQSNLYQGPNGGAGCQENRRVAKIACTDATYTALLQRGIELGATFIEVWEPDVLKYPDAFAKVDAGWK